MLRAFFAAVLVFSGISGQSQAKDWSAVLAEARGQTVHFNAWGGDDRINAYIAWVGEERRPLRRDREAHQSHRHRRRRDPGAGGEDGRAHGGRYHEPRLDQW